MARLRDDLTAKITAALDPGDAHLLPSPAGRWPRIWSTMKRFITHLGPGHRGGRAEAREGEEGEEQLAPSAEELQLQLAELHSDIYEQVRRGLRWRMPACLYCHVPCLYCLGMCCS